MSPEQARAQAIDGRSDIYSLGVVAYQALTGTVPYDGEDSFSIGYKHITEPVPDPAAHYGGRASSLRGDQADAHEGPGRSLSELRGAGRVHSGPADRGGGKPCAPRWPRPASRSAWVRRRPARRCGVPPLIVSQPTTPLDSPIVEPPGRRPESAGIGSRRVADRSLAMRQRSSSSLAWLWVVLAVLGGSGAAYYYYRSRGFAPGPSTRHRFGRGAGGRRPQVDPHPSSGGARSGNDLDCRIAAAGRHSSPRGHATPQPRRHSASPPQPSAQPHLTPPPPAGRAGPGRQREHPGRRASARLHRHDRRAAGVGAAHPSPVRPSRARVSAPRFNFYSDTIVMSRARPLEITPELSPLGAPAPVTEPGAEAAPAPVAPQSTAARRVRLQRATAPASTSAPSR